MAVDYASATIAYGGTPSTITLLELAKQLAGVVGSSEDDTWTLYLQMAGEAAERYCDNKLVSQNVTQRHVCIEQPIELRYEPVTSLDNVVIDGEDVTADYVLYHKDGIHYAKRETGTSTAGKMVQVNVTYTTGYDPLPADVGYALSRTATDYQKDDPSAVAPIKKETVVGVGSLEYDVKNYLVGEFGVLTRETLTILDKYKRYHA